MKHQYGTFCAEPSSEDAWEDMYLSPEEQDDVLQDCVEDSQKYDYSDGYEL
jgi:hypothetical protein